MKTWALIPCSKTKATVPCAAINMYWRSALFRGAAQSAEAKGQAVLILSAKHGVLRPDTEIEPYDVTLIGMPVAQRKAWAGAVLRGLLTMLTPGDEVVSYLGEQYAEFVLPALRGTFRVSEPLKGMSQGKRLAWFKRERGADC